jgi:hypothetical protein
LEWQLLLNTRGKQAARQQESKSYFLKKISPYITPDRNPGNPSAEDNLSKLTSLSGLSRLQQQLMVRLKLKVNTFRSGTGLSGVISHDSRRSNNIPAAGDASGVSAQIYQKTDPECNIVGTCFFVCIFMFIIYCYTYMTGNTKVSLMTGPSNVAENKL